MIGDERTVKIETLFQAMLFYLPRAIWLTQEGGLIKHLAKDKCEKVIEDADEKCCFLLDTFTVRSVLKFYRR